MLVVGIAAEHARAHFHKGYTAAVVGVHIGVNLENEAGESFLLWLHSALLSLCWARRWRDAHEAVEQLLHTEGVECRTEEYRCNLSAQVVGFAKFGINALDQLQVVAQLLGIGFAHCSIDSRVVDVVDFHALGHLLLVGGE